MSTPRRGEEAPDVLVVGAGVAGALCAARLVEAGVDALLVAHRPGASALHYGVWSLGAQGLSTLTPQLADELEPALACLQAGLPELALRRGRFRVVDVEGRVRVGELAPDTIAAQLDLPEGAAVVDLEPLGHPFAGLIRFERPDMPTLSVSWPSSPGVFGRSLASVASALGTDEGLDAFAGALKASVAAAGVPGVLLPPVLGLRAPAAALARLRAAVGVPVAEAAGGHPSTHGLRLHLALEAWLGRLGLPRVTGEVSEINPSTLEVRVADRALRPRAVVLATGGFIPGGLRELEEGVAEPLVGAPVSPRQPANALTAAPDAGPWGGPLFRVGLPVDERMRPLRPNGEPVHQRLFAAGEIISAGDRAASRWASGLCLASGWRAGAEAGAASKMGGG